MIKIRSEACLWSIQRENGLYRWSIISDSKTLVIEDPDKPAIIKLIELSALKQGDGLEPFRDIGSCAVVHPQRSRRCRE